ncbi:ABC transporter substrate-binding protein [Streptomycetaceae bacterium NBC_01309]
MLSSRSHRTRTLACALAAATAVCSCTIEDDAPAAPAGSPPAGAAAIAPGVSANSIKLGVAYPDLSSVKQFVNLDHGDYEAAFNTLIKKINDAGGINGRKIVPVYAKSNLLSPAAAQETCVKLTEDEKVFAVLAVAIGEEQALCYAGTHKTALVGWAQSKEAAAKVQAPWFTYFAAGDAPIGGMEVFASRGDFAGRKVAVVANAQEQTSVDKNVLPALQGLGVTPVATGYLPNTGGDAAAYAQQANVFFQKAQSAGADTVLMVGQVSAALPQVLEKTPWRPKLLFTVPPSPYLADRGKHDFGILAGSVVASQVPDWDDPAMQQCVRDVEQAVPALAGKLTDPAKVPSGQPQLAFSVSAACQTLTLFKAIADKAGPDLNHATFQQAGYSLGRVHIPGLRDDATYSPQSTNGSIPIRPLTYDAANNTYVPAGP